MNDIIGRTFNGYQVIEQIGSGGMATVYKAYQPSLDRYVALKFLPPYYAQQDDSFLERFKREAHVVARLRHPNILMVMDFGQDDDLSYIVMDYVEAGTLKERMWKPMTLAEISTFISQIASALEYAHDEGVVHRDVKPSNVLLPKPDWALLTDFGLAHMVGGSMLTQSGLSVGTPAYMSPEQGSGEAIDSRSDVYSLGVMLYEMTTGEVPYTAETPIAVMVKHIIEPLPIPRERNPKLLEGLERIVLKAMAKDPNDRFETTGKLADAVKSVAAEHPDWLSPPHAMPANIQKPKSDVLKSDSDPGKDVDPAIFESPAETLDVFSPKSSKSRSRTRKRILGSVLVVAVLGLIGYFVYVNQWNPLDTPTNSTYIPQSLEPNAEMVVALQLLADGQIEQALAAFEEVLENSPDQWAIYEVTTNSVYNNGRETELAIRMLEAGLWYVEQPSEDTLTTLAYWYMEVGDINQARDTFNWALDIYPNDPWLYIGLAEAFIELGDTEQAGKAAREAIIRADSDGELLESAGWLSYEIGKYFQAIDAFEQAIAADSTEPWNYIGLAELYVILQENLDQIPSLALNAVQNSQNDSSLLASVGWLFIEIQDCDLARLYFNEALALDPQSLDAQDGLDDCAQTDS